MSKTSVIKQHALLPLSLEGWVTAEQKGEFVDRLIEDLREKCAAANTNESAPKIDSDRLLLTLRKELLPLSPKTLSDFKHKSERSEDRNFLSNLATFLDNGVRLNSYKIGMLDKNPTVIAESLSTLKLTKYKLSTYVLIDEEQFDYLFKEREGGDPKESEAFIAIGEVLRSDRKEITKKEMIDIFRKTLNVKNNYTSNHAADVRLTRILAKLVDEGVLARS